MYISSYELEMGGRGNSRKVTLDLGGVSATDCIKLQQLCHSGNPVKVDIIPADNFGIAINSVYGLSQCRTVNVDCFKDMYPTITVTSNKAEVKNMADFKAIDKAYGEGYEDGKNHAKTWCKDECLYIKKVIFNNPATIVFWSDGTKTVAKAHGKDKFDKEIGLTVCIAKRALKNKKKWDEVFKKWIKE